MPRRFSPSPPAMVDDRSRRWWSWAAAGLALVIGLGLTVAGTLLASQRLQDTAREAAQQTAARTAERLLATLEPMDAFNLAVRAYVVSDPTHSIAETTAFMDRLSDTWSGFRSAVLAPDNTVQVVVPRSGNEAVLGLHYPDLPAQWTDIQRAIAERHSILAGPIDLVQGGRGLAYRTPIFLEDGSYWGLVTTTVDPEALVAPADPEGSPTDAAIRDIDTDQVVVGDESVFAHGPAVAVVGPFDRRWQVGVLTAPVDDYPAFAVSLVGLLGTVLLTVLVFLVVDSRLRSGRLVRLLNGLAQQAPGMLFQMRQWPEGRSEMTYATPGLTEIVGVEVTGSDAWATIERLVHPEDRETVRRTRQEATDALKPWRQRFRVVLPDGSVRWVLTDAQPERQPDGSTIWYGWSGDVTADLAEEDSLRLSASLFEATREGVVVLDPDGRISDINPGLSKLTGFTREQVLGRELTDYTAGVMPDETMAELWSQLETYGYWRGEISGQDGNGAMRTDTASALAIRDDSGRLSHYLIVLDDVSLARDDSVTGLPNAHTLDDRIRSAVLDADLSGHRVALIVIALDQFRQVNDAYGHRTGDALLRVIAHRLVANSPAVASVARLRGDEFAVLLPVVFDLSEVDATVNDCLDAVALPIEVGSRVILVSASAGVAIYPDGQGQALRLTTQASQALRASRGGHTRVSYFTPQMAEESRERTGLVDDLTQALLHADPADPSKASEFSIALQPVVDLRTGSTTKAEALVRWNRAGGGVVAPDVFIPLAEQTGRITDVDDVVFGHVVDAAAQLRAVDPAFRVTFNLSPIELQESPDRHERRLSALTNAGLPEDALVAEITEGALLSRDAAVEENLALYRNAGLQFAIDDFGTGYSSLAYLRQLDAAYLKIDREFVGRLHSGGGDVAVCRAIVAMAKAMGIEVIAEGVETEVQLGLLREMGCDFAQGFLFAHPMPLDDLLDRISQAD